MGFAFQIKVEPIDPVVPTKESRKSARGFRLASAKPKVVQDTVNDEIEFRNYFDKNLAHQPDILPPSGFSKEIKGWNYVGPKGRRLRKGDIPLNAPIEITFEAVEFGTPSGPSVPVHWATSLTTQSVIQSQPQPAPTPSREPQRPQFPAFSPGHLQRPTPAPASSQRQRHQSPSRLISPPFQCQARDQECPASSQSSERNSSPEEHPNPSSWPWRPVVWSTSQPSPSPKPRSKSPINHALRSAKQVPQSLTSRRRTEEHLRSSTPIQKKKRRRSHIRSYLKDSSMFDVHVEISLVKSSDDDTPPPSCSPTPEPGSGFTLPRRVTFFDVVLNPV